ncbi:proteasome regulatory particle lid subunit SEM1 [Sporobolomyces koalae]|uniref:proteasome regulatory particle lid subunit SEM1 n=1 Tax=Sporobolomyces koalae TaxID=500713 RepID=UPI00316C1C8C
MSTTTAPTQAPSTNGQAKPEANPHLLPLQEDDEFEEFPEADWDESETFGASLASKAGQPGAKSLDLLWEDNWDDDDVSDDFSVQLRGELLKQSEQQQMQS